MSKTLFSISTFFKGVLSWVYDYFKKKTKRKMNYKDKEEIKKIVDEELEDCDFLNCLSVRDCNYNPHPYTIGLKHIHHASDNHGGILNGRTIEKVPCAVRGCRLSYDQHTYERVVFLQFTRNVSEKEFKDKLVEINDHFKEGDYSGFGFVETSEEFRVKEHMSK